MKFGIFAASLLIIAAACHVQAEDGVPSQSKLSKLGLGSMQVADDHQGMEVRGEGYAQVGAQFYVSNGGGGILPFGFGFFPGFPVGGFGGTAIQQTGSATGGVLLPAAPGLVAQANVGTTPANPVNGLPIIALTTPISVTNSVTVNGNIGTSSAVGFGSIWAFGF